MPVPSHDPHGVMPEPSGDGIFAGSDSMATQISEIADGDARVLELLHDLDPDQVDGGVAGKRLGLGFWLSAGWFAAVVLAAVLAPILPLDDYRIPSGRPRLAPSPEHWFGTDMLGRDIFSRVVWGARVSLVVGFASIVLGLVIGGTMGVVAGYVKKRTESILMGMVDVLLAFPALLLALAIVSFREDRSIPNVVLAIGIISIAPIARLVRAATLVYSQREFVTASRSLGASDLRIIVKEILPNVMLPVVSFSIIGVAVAIVAEGGLAFLGLSVAPPQPTWGGMINDGRSQLADYPYMSMIPATVMFLTVLSLNLAGDRLREYFDIKEGAL
jgi:peptide/nickel transport system permease protein